MSYSAFIAAKYSFISFHACAAPSGGHTNVRTHQAQGLRLTSDKVAPCSCCSEALAVSTAASLIAAHSEVFLVKMDICNRAH